VKKNDRLPTSPELELSRGRENHQYPVWNLGPRAIYVERNVVGCTSEISLCANIYPYFRNLNDLQMFLVMHALSSDEEIMVVISRRPRSHVWFSNL